MAPKKAGIPFLTSEQPVAQRIAPASQAAGLDPRRRRRASRPGWRSRAARRTPLRCSALHGGGAGALGGTGGSGTWRLHPHPSPQRELPNFGTSTSPHQGPWRPPFAEGGRSPLPSWCCRCSRPRRRPSTGVSAAHVPRGSGDASAMRSRASSSDARRAARRTAPAARRRSAAQYGGAFRLRLCSRCASRRRAPTALIAHRAAASGAFGGNRAA
jgi:hypothetical protein